MSEFVDLSRDDGVATVTVDLPEKRNAMDVETRTQFRYAVERVAEDDRSRVLVVRGAGSESFIVGGDLETMAEYDALEGLRYLTEHAQGLYNYIAEIPLPTVAGIDGYAFGGGLELALACDLRVVSASAQLGLPEVGVGLLPGSGGTQRLTRIAGAGVAKDLVLTGRTVDAQEAKELGIVTRVYDDGEFEAGLDDLTNELRSQAPVAQRLAKKAIDTPEFDAGLDVERLAGAVLFGTDDFEEGVSAFYDNRSPEFRGQ